MDVDVETLGTKELAYHITLLDWDLFWAIHEYELLYHTFGRHHFGKVRKGERKGSSSKRNRDDLEGCAICENMSFHAGPPFLFFRVCVSDHRQLGRVYTEI